MLPEQFLPMGYRFVVYFEFDNFSDLNKENFKKKFENVDLNVGEKLKNAYDLMFQSVSGLSVDIETEEYTEGGENRFKHTLPKRTKFPNLVLKRGLAPSSAVTDWIQNAVENFEFSPIDITIILQNELRAPLHVWSIYGAIPIKWSVGDFNAEESKIVIETLELKYNFFTVKNPEELGADFKAGVLS